METPGIPCDVTVIGHVIIRRVSMQTYFHTCMIHLIISVVCTNMYQEDTQITYLPYIYIHIIFKSCDWRNNINFQPYSDVMAICKIQSGWSIRQLRPLQILVSRWLHGGPNLALCIAWASVFAAPLILCLFCNPLRIIKHFLNWSCH